MKTKIKFGLAAIFLFLTTILMFTQSQIMAESVQHRIVSLDSAGTETLFALGMGEYIIGRDSASVYPPKAEKISVLGDMFSFNPEAVLAEHPTLITANPNRMRPQTMEQLRSAAVDFLPVPDEATIEGAITRIKMISEAVGRQEEGADIIADINKSMRNLAQKLESRKEKPPLRVLCVISMGGQILVLGEESHLVGMVKVTGAVNAVPELKRYSPINAEAVINAAPDVVLIGTDSESMEERVKELLKSPGIALTPAGKNQRVVAMDALFLSGFGPRVGKAALDLYHGFYEVEGSYLSKVK
jgi:iron complex transport system substrate-binding protein